MSITSALSELAWWQELLLIALALTSFVYVFYFRIWVALATGSDLIFALALGVAITSVATSAPFDRAGFELVERSPLPEALASTDRRVAAIESLPGDLIDRALAQLGIDPPIDVDAPEPIQPGPFESKIRPSVEALVSIVVRAMSFFCASLLLLVALAMRSSTSTARALQTVMARADALENQLTAMRASPAPLASATPGPSQARSTPTPSSLPGGGES